MKQTKYLQEEFICLTGGQTDRQLDWQMDRQSYRPVVFLLHIDCEHADQMGYSRKPCNKIKTPWYLDLMQTFSTVIILIVYTI